MSVLGAVVFLFGPLLALVLAGAVAVALDGRRPWAAILVLVAVSSMSWLVYVGLYQHENPCGNSLRSTGCPTVYGYDAPLPDDHDLGGLILLGGFALPAAWFGSRRSVPPLAIGASLALGPTLLAWWTAPRGDNTGLWALVLWALPIWGGLAALLAAGAGWDWRSAARSKRRAVER
jgi:hypothetical protein